MGLLLKALQEAKMVSVPITSSKSFMAPESSKDLSQDGEDVIGAAEENEEPAPGQKSVQGEAIVEARIPRDDVIEAAEENKESAQRKKSVQEEGIVEEHIDNPAQNAIENSSKRGRSGRPVHRSIMDRSTQR